VAAGCGVVGCVVEGGGFVTVVGVFPSGAPGFSSAAGGVVPGV